MTVHTDTPPDGWAWPVEERELIEVQQRLVLAARDAVLWQPPDDRDLRVAAFFIGHARGLHGPGDRGDPAWVGAAGFDGDRLVASAVTRGEAGWPYIPGLLALREGRLLAGGLESLKWHADLLLVNATGADHPRRSGLALHLGAAAGLPSVGVTDRPLISQGAEPGPRRGDSEPLVVEDEVVGYRLRTRAGVRPICVHAAWRTTPELARDAVLGLCRGFRTPEPLRHARRLARQSRAAGPDVVREASANWTAFCRPTPARDPAPTPCEADVGTPSRLCTAPVGMAGRPGQADQLLQHPAGLVRVPVADRRPEWG